MTIHPLADRIVVKRIEEKQQTQNGLFIPDSAQEKPQEALVTAVGKGKRLEDGTRSPMDVKVGDRILLGKYSGSEVRLDGQDYTIVREDEVLGVLDSAAPPAKA
jgi:chaperonin GroES